MPLMKRKSEKAFKHNIEAEMESGKPQKQALAIAYSVKRRAKKASGGTVESGSPDMNMAEGGHLDANARKHIKAKNFAGPDRSYPIEDEAHARNALARVSQHGSPELQAKVRAKVHKKYPGIEMKAEGGEISANDEKHPMPDNEYNDKLMASHNKAKKALIDSDWTGRPTERQAQMNNGRKVMPIKRPKMVPSDAFSTKLYDQEGNLEESARPGPYGEKPQRAYDEEDADMHGHPVRDMEDEHSTHKKPYAKGGEVEQEDYRHPMNKYEDDLLDLEPSHDEGRMMADSHNEMDADSHGDDVPDMEKPHNEDQDKIYGYNEGGDIDDSLEHEEEEEHHNSIAAAIMARKARKAGHEAAMSDSDIDEMMHLYEGGDIMEKASRIKSHDSIYSDDSDQADLSRNHDEDANEEDQLSFNALRKENYNDSNLEAVNHMDSAQHGDDIESDKHDMISRIRSKMKRKQF